MKEGLDFSQYKSGEFKHGPLKFRYTHNGIFYEVDSPEFMELLKTEGLKDENKDTLLGLMARYVRDL